MCKADTFNILDLTPGSILVNVQSGPRTDRGDLYLSGALDHAFELVLPANVRTANRGDVARIASLRGVYLANVFSPPLDQVGGCILCVVVAQLVWNRWLLTLLLTTGPTGTMWLFPTRSPLHATFPMSSFATCTFSAGRRE